MGYLHHNVPGVLAAINQLLADAGANVVGQSLSTRGELGYVVTDTDVALPERRRAGRPAPVARRPIWLRTWPA